MERPKYDEIITRQNQLYAMDVLEKFRARQKAPDAVLQAVTEAFILGAGGYEGSFDAALVLEHGGLAVLLSHLGLADMDTSKLEVENDKFEEAIHAAVDYGASYDALEEEIPEGAISDADITGKVLGPLTTKFTIPIDEGGRLRPNQRPDWRSE